MLITPSQMKTLNRTQIRTFTSLASALILSGMLGLLAGCETTSSQTGGPQAASNVEVFRDGAKPSRDYKEIRVLTDDGRENEQKEIETKMIAKAAKLGGNAIIFDKPKQSGVEAQPFSFGRFDLTYLYKGAVVVYQ
jgi:hypothetical protein